MYTNNFPLDIIAVEMQNQTRMGRVGGWISWEYNQLSPQLKLEFGLGLSLAIFSFQLQQFAGKK